MLRWCRAAADGAMIDRYILGALLYCVWALGFGKALGGLFVSSSKNARL